MNKKKRIFLKKRKVKYSIPNYKQEEQLFINPKKYRFKKNKNNKVKLICLASFIIIIIFFSIIFIKKFHKNPTPIAKNIFDKYNVIYNKFNINEKEIFKYKDMIPRLSPDINSSIPSMEEIFNEKQIYIFDVKITPDYLKFLRPFNEKEEEKYKKRYSEGETAINKTLFERRSDQLDYKEYCRIALEEKFLDNNQAGNKEIKLEKNRPLISIVIPSYNKGNLLLKSIRSIQNQKYKNFEIIIVNDCSNDNSTEIFNYLLKTEPRVRIIHHMKNMGCWRTRLEGIIYSKGKYVILFDAGDLYEDNYVLTDALNVIEKYNLDSCKFLFRVIRSFKTLENSVVYFHVNGKDKIVYESSNIERLNSRVFTTWGNIWNRLVRDNIYSKAIFLLNEQMLNLHKNLWDDVWFNNIVHKVSYSYAIFERIGYVYLQDWGGEGIPRWGTDEEKSRLVKEYVGFLSFDYNFASDKESKTNIIDTLKQYEKGNAKFKLGNFRAHFEVLNELLENLIKDPDVSNDDKKYCEKLLEESKQREKDVNQKK